MLVTAAEPNADRRGQTAERRSTTRAPPGRLTRRRVERVSVRAGIVVTGTEVLTGRVQDRNGPWLAEQLLELGVELAHITICGDRPEDIEAQLRFLAADGVDLILTSGGLGPTADDMTVAMVARFCGRELGAGLRTRTDHRQHPQEAHAALRRSGLRRRHGRQPQAGHGACGRPRAHAGRDRARCRGAGQADRRRATRPAARATTHVAQGGTDRRRAGGDRRPHGLPSGHDPHVRASRVRVGRDTAGTPSRRSPGSIGWRSRRVCAAASSRSSLATSPTPKRATSSWSTCSATAMAANCSPPTGRSSTTRSPNSCRVAPSRRRSRAPRGWSRPV